MGKAQRRTSTTTVTNVRVLAEPLGEARENGPHLQDLRNFVEACEGLPGETLVRITEGPLNGAGRHVVEFGLTYTHPSGEEG